MGNKKILSLIFNFSLLSTSIMSIQPVYASEVSNTNTSGQDIVTDQKYIVDPIKKVFMGDQENSSKFQLTEEKNVGKIDLPKIKADLDNHNKIFEENRNILFKGLSIDDITSFAHGDIIKREVAKKIAANIRSKQPESIPKIEELKKTLSKDDKIGKVENIEDVIKELIINWNKFTDRPLVKAIQLAAIKKFHLPYASTDRWKADELGEYESHIDTIGIILEEMKNETQSFFKSKGIKELTLFRGVKSSTKMNENGVDVQQLAALSSFSFSKTSAGDYATTSNPAIHPYLLVKNVPIDRILSLGVTGFGLMEHYEVVVLGGMYPKDESFVLPGETGSAFKLFLKAQARELHEGGALDLLREMMSDEAGKQLKKHSELIANQLDKIIEETPDLKPNIVKETIYSFLIGEPLRLDNDIALEIAHVFS
ncbi:hypothetical protein BK708_37580 [Bacillus thuringiensis serovar yunnanensis]|nr:hypothetical protein BK708_37580 [Bacillus thuringiensis serovar yunnanensis]